MQSFKPLFDLLSAHYGWGPAAAVWLSWLVLAFRLVFKWFNGPLQARLTAALVRAAQSPDAREQAWYEALLGSATYRALAFTCDMVFSIKFPTLGDFLRLVEAPPAPPQDSTGPKLNPALPTAAFVALGLAGALACTLLSGCVSPATTTSSGSTNSVSATTPAIVTNAYLGTNGVVTKIAYGALKIGAKEGALYAMAQDSNAKAYFQAASVGLNSLLNAGTYDSQSLSNCLNSISISEIRTSAQIQSWIGDVLDLYHDTEADVVTQGLDQIAYLKPALQNVTAGIDAALALQN